MTDLSLSTAGLMMAGFVAISTTMLSCWERFRPKLNRPGRLDLLSLRIRRVGIWLMWVESVLMAIGSQLPMEERSDRILFVWIWISVGAVALVLVCMAFADGMLRLVSHRIRVAALAEVRRRLNETIVKDRDRQGWLDALDEEIG